MPKTNFFQTELINSSQLVTIAEASKILGAGFSRRSIFRLIDSGEWREGKEWVDERRVRGNGQRRKIKININFIQRKRFN